MSDPLLLPPDPSNRSGRHVEPAAAGAEPDSTRPFADGFTLRELFEIVHRHLGLALLVAAITVAPVLVLIVREQPVYRAAALIRLADARRAVTGALGEAVGERFGGAQVDAILSEIEVLKGRTVLGEVVDREGLRLVSASSGFAPAYLAHVWVAPDAAPTTLRLVFRDDSVVVRVGDDSIPVAYGAEAAVAGAHFVVPARPDRDAARLMVVEREVAIDHLAEHLVAEPRALTDAVEVAYLAADPRTAQRVANAAVDVFEAASARSAQQASRRRRAFLEEQLRSTDSLLADAQLALSAFRSRERIYSSREVIAAQQQSMVNVRMRREELNADRRMYESLLRNLSGSDENASRALRALVSSPGIATNLVVAQLYTQLAAYEAARDSLTTGPFASTPGHPDVVRLTGLIRTTQSKLEDAVRSHIRSLEARIAALDALNLQGSAQIADMPGVEVEEVRLVHQVETIQAVADQMRQELQRARIAEAVQAGRVEVVHHAPLPIDPEKTGRLFRLIAGVLLAGLLGSGAAVAREVGNTAIRRREDLEQVLRVPGLATIPQITTDSPAGRRLPLPLTSRRTAVPATRPLLDGGGARTPQSEAYRMLRNSIEFSPVFSGLGTVAVTSAFPGEGKTTTAANLAITFARQGTRVLLIDCDFHRARVHELFGVPRGPGLRDVLADRRRSPGRATHPTSFRRLKIMPAGTRTDDGYPALAGERMKQMLKRLAKSFRLIILDAPPVLVAADAGALAAMADGVLLVIRAGRTDRIGAHAAVQQLNLVGGKVIGAVLNDADSTLDRYGDYVYTAYYDYHAVADPESEADGEAVHANAETEDGPARDESGRFVPADRTGSDDPSGADR